MKLHVTSVAQAAVAMLVLQGQLLHAQSVPEGNAASPPEPSVSGASVVPSDTHAAPSVAAAEDSNAEILWDGLAAFADGEYAQAIDLFELHYALHPNPATLFNLARAHGRLRQCQQARAFLKRYLQEESHPPVEFYEGSAALDRDCPIPPAAQFDSLQPSEMPMSASQAPVQVTPSPAESAPPERAAAATQARSERPTPNYRPWGYSLLAAGGFSALASVYFGVQAVHTNRDLELLAKQLSDDPTRTWDDAAEPLVSREARQDAMATSFGVGALALGAAGLALLLAPRHGVEPPPGGGTWTRQPRTLIVHGSRQSVWAGYAGTF